MENFTKYLKRTKTNTVWYSEISYKNRSMKQNRETINRPTNMVNQFFLIAKTIQEKKFSIFTTFYQKNLTSYLVSYKNEIKITLYVNIKPKTQTSRREFWRKYL